MNVEWWARTFGEPLQSARLTVRERFEHRSKADGYVAGVITRALGQSVVHIMVEQMNVVRKMAFEPQHAVADVDDMRAALPRIERFDVFYDSAQDCCITSAEQRTAEYNVLRVDACKSPCAIHDDDDDMYFEYAETCDACWDDHQMPAADQ